MYRRILLLMDCSSVDEAVVKHIVELAEIHGSEVHFFHVIHAHTLDQRSAFEQRANHCLNLAIDMSRRKGIQAHQSTAEGEPVEQILRHLEGEEYDLIALATHGHGRVSAAILGSVSRALKANTDTPILTIRGKR